MRFLNVIFTLAILGTLLWILPMTGRDMLIAAQSVSPTMPAILG